LFLSNVVGAGVLGLTCYQPPLVSQGVWQTDLLMEARGFSSAPDSVTGLYEHPS